VSRRLAAHIKGMSKPQSPAPNRPRTRRPAVLGVTSDGVEILKPVRGKRNLTDRQVRQIVDGMLRLKRERELARNGTPGQSD
jgi:hypothetical protein